MELVEGPTLADRIARGPIPLDEALPIAKQIAEALEAAHEQGIIHRDLRKHMGRRERSGGGWQTVGRMRGGTRGGAGAAMGGGGEEAVWGGGQAKERRWG